MAVMMINCQLDTEGREEAATARDWQGGLDREGIAGADLGEVEASR